MKYEVEIQSARSDPQRLESLYQSARQANEEPEFRADLLRLYEQSPQDVLLSAWRHRFDQSPLPKAARKIRWDLAMILGAITGLCLWAISDPSLMIRDHTPYYLILWSPIATIFSLVFLNLVAKKYKLLNLIIGILVALAPIYVIFMAYQQRPPQYFRYYLEMMAFHLPLLCWIGLGIATMGKRSHTNDRFAFLIKSVEVAIAAGLYLIFGIAFGMITIGMFSALNITPPDVIFRLITFGGFGLLPILAVATMYDPALSPMDQDFSQGLSKFIATMMRLLLPLTLLILVVYICVIPFNFLAPFKQRDVLIIYNLMLFAVIGLMISATPLHAQELPLKLQTALRNGILAVAVLAVLISLYALSAIIYRTAIDHITMNRTMVIGWNGINIAILISIIYTQLRGGFEGWAARLHTVFSRAAPVYLIWTIFLIIAIPLLFR